MCSEFESGLLSLVRCGSGSASLHNAQSDRSGGCGNLFDPPWGLQGGSESFHTFTNVTFRMGHEGMPPFSLQGTVCGKCHSQPLVLELFLSAHLQLGCHVVPLCRAPQGPRPVPGSQSLAPAQAGGPALEGRALSGAYHVWYAPWHGCCAGRSGPGGGTATHLQVQKGGCRLIRICQVWAHTPSCLLSKRRQSSLS